MRGRALAAVLRDARDHQRRPLLATVHGTFLRRDPLETREEVVSLGGKLRLVLRACE